MPADAHCLEPQLFVLRSNFKLSVMSLSFTLSILLRFGDFTYGSHIEDGAAVPSVEDPLIPAPVPTIAADADCPWAAMDELFEPLDDPQKSETWSISKSQKIKDEEEGKIFVGHYQKRDIHHLKEEEKKQLGTMGEAIGSPWTRVSIWKQIGTGNGILTSYNRTDNPDQIMWAIGEEGKVWWKKETPGYPPHKPGDGFPILKYRFEMEYDYFCKLRVVHNAIKELHTNPEYETKLTYQEMAEQVDDLVNQKNALLTHNAYLTQQYEDLKVRAAEQGSPILPPQATPPFRPFDHGDNPEALKKEVTMLKTQNDDLKMRESAAIQNWKDEKVALEHEHTKTMAEMVDRGSHWSSIVKWSCIVGAIAVVITALAMICGFRHYLSSLKKQWEIQRLRKLLSVNKDYRKADVIIAAHREVAESIVEGLEQRAPVEEERYDSEGPGGYQPAPVSHPPQAQGDRFNNLMLNSAAVQGVMMNDVVEAMHTEGDDTGV